MRNHRHLAGLAAVIVSAHLASGCRMIEYHMGLLAEPAETVAQPVRTRKASRIAKPKPVAAGQTLREFCGRRHVEFQAGKLNERPDEMARNNDLCKQLYTTDGPVKQG